MSQRPVDRIQSLFDQVVVLPPHERAAFLDTACADDPETRSEVVSLLACDAGFSPTRPDEGRLQSPLVRPLATATSGNESEREEPSLSIPARMGRYRIVRRIAEGGMGAVYEAVQDSPCRAVALKVIRPGLASPAFLQRFSHEAQILGRLHHSGIAEVYEADFAEDGQPFFVMEFIRGVALDDYASRQNLEIAGRVELFARVCDAVQHAHDRGVIHRDLKPANILVNEAGQPKVLDFGVARLTDADLVTGAGLTQTGQLLGTPNYMSPEQVAADPDAIDHRADEYALGIILYELLAHRLPYRLDQCPLPEVARRIVEQDPPSLGSINPELRGDLETIVAKAIEKERTRRYGSVADLAADLRRWLGHEPILARQPSALYHLKKFARRHRALVGGVAATMAALALGLVGTILFAVAEAHQRHQADRHARQAEREKKEARFQSYRARMSAAVSALAVHDVADADRHLRAAPEELRNWEWRHLASRLDDSTRVIPLPPAPHISLLPGPTSPRVARVSPAGVELMELLSGAHTYCPIPEGHLPPFSPNATNQGLRIASWISQNQFVLLDELGNTLAQLESPEGKAPTRVLISADGRHAATFLDPNRTSFAVLDVATGRQTLLSRNAPEQVVWPLAFSLDGRLIASGGEDRTVRIWETETGRLVAECSGHTARIDKLAFRPDGLRLLSTSADGTVRQWDTATGAAVEAPYDRHIGDVVTATYDPTGKWIASGGADRTIRVWQAAGRDDVTVLHGHTGTVAEIGFDPDGLHLTSLSRDTGLQGAGDLTVRIWDLDLASSLPVLRGHTSYVYPVAYSPDGRWLASGGWDHTLRLWDAETAEPVATLPHPGAIPCLAFSPDGRWLVSGGEGPARLRFWSLPTAQVLRGIEGPQGTLYSLHVSPDGQRVAATAIAELPAFQFSVHDVATGARVFEREAAALGYSPDGRWLAIRDSDQKVVVLLDAKTHEPEARLEGHEQPVMQAAFSPDGRLLATTSQDRTVRVWTLETGACQVLRGHTAEVFAVAFHPDGTRLASGGRDQAIWLWDLNRGEDVARLQGHTSYVWSLAFSSDGATLVSGSGDFSVRLWDSAPRRTRYEARRRAAALQPDADKWVERLLSETTDPAAVAEAVRTDSSHDDSQKHAALRALLRYQAGGKAATLP